MVLTITYHNSQIDFLALHIFKKQLGFLNTIIFQKLMSKTEIQSLPANIPAVIQFSKEHIYNMNSSILFFCCTLLVKIRETPGSILFLYFCIYMKILTLQHFFCNWS